MAPLSYAGLQKLKLLEVSALGIHQLAAGVAVTERRDRELLAKLLAVVPRRPDRLALPRVGWEMMLGSSGADRRRIAEQLNAALSARKSA